MAHEQSFRLNANGPNISETRIFSSGSIRIGRGSENELVLPDRQVSRFHARLDWTSLGCILTDLSSSNGTRVNGEKVDPLIPILVCERTTIQIGSYELYLDVLADSSPALQGEDQEKLEDSISIPQPPEEPRSIEPPGSPPPESHTASEPVVPSGIPPGLSSHSMRLLRYLPEAYHTNFMSRFLALFESVLLPLEWNIDGFDLLLSPRTTRADLLSWLERWFGIVNDPVWTETQRREFLEDIHLIYSRRGTAWALKRVLEIYTGKTPQIIDTADDLKPCTFLIRLPLASNTVDRAMLDRLIITEKPAWTEYLLEFKE